MIRLLKMLVFTALVLLLGQIPVGSRTVAEHFRVGLFEAAGKAGRGIADSRLVASVSRHLPGYGSSAKVRNGAPQDDDEGDVEEGNDHESVSTADRESLLRVLQ